MNYATRAVDITELPPAQYNLTVYDSERDYRKNIHLFAYPQFGLNNITVVIIEQPLSSLLPTSYLIATPIGIAIAVL